MADQDLLLHPIEDVLRNCRRYYSSEDYQSTDRILFCLESCSSLFSAYLSSILYAHPLPGSSGSEVTQLRHLHWCLDQLIITWRTKLLRIEGVTAMQTERGGRPPKTINIELVRM